VKSVVATSAQQAVNMTVSSIDEIT